MGLKRLRFFLIFFLFVFLLVPAFLVASPDTCLMCHEDPDLTKDLGNGKTESMFVELEQFKKSIHGDMDCTDCHQDLAGVEDFPHKSNLQPVDCGMCHSDVVEQYQKSYHYQVTQLGNKNAPNCITCHGKHDILPTTNSMSPINKRNIYKLCGMCHGSENQLNENVILPRVIENYSESVHSQAIAEGNLKAAACTDCHGTHDLRGAGDPNSGINRWRIPDTCGKCHTKIHDEYLASIHGEAFRMGISQSPICTDCHGEHGIQGRDSKTSATFDKEKIQTLCLECHKDPRILAKFGSQLGIGVEFVDSYHGLSLQLDNERAATCISCHGDHLILPARNKLSTIAPDNVVKTCAKCHKGASETFARSYTHETADAQKNAIVGTVEDLYIWLILLTIGGMLLHNLIIFAHYLLHKYFHEKKETTLPRFNMQEIIQHILLAVTFGGLVITGFALKFSDNALIHYFVSLGLTEEIRSVLHRIFAVGLVSTGIWHMVYLVVTVRGRRQLRALMFVMDDIRNAVLTLKYHLGFSRQHPVNAQYDYTEKMEYWALIWGTAIMTLTGLVLWFPLFFTQLFPYWIVKVSEIIHFYEAILATLAIIVWHFFFVIFHPHEYPMNLSWLTGRIPIDLAEEKYPKWVKQVEKEEHADKYRQKK